MTRGLHAHTKMQRASGGDHGNWVVPDDPTPEERDVPPRRVAQTLLASVVLLGVSLGLVALLMVTIEKRHPITPANAEARFRTAGPPLAPDPLAERLALERPALRNLDGSDSRSSIEAAMAKVAREGWGVPETSPPSGAKTALERARTQPR